MDKARLAYIRQRFETCVHSLDDMWHEWNTHFDRPFLEPVREECIADYRDVIKLLDDTSDAWGEGWL